MKYKCPNCGNLADVLICKIIGQCSMDANSEDGSQIEEWETGDCSCEECGYEENNWNDNFELVEG